MRSIKKIHKALNRPMGDLITYSPLPTNSLEQIDPFIFLNHHGPQEYEPNNSGLPFGPHPHRGMETVTFIIDGDIVHKDSEGHQSKITGGGVQWMTAGSGLLHSEVSSEEFKKNGGNVEILQLWVNLPSNLKMVQPDYKGLQKEDIPTISPSDGIKVKLVAGDWDNYQGAIKPLTDLMLSRIDFDKGSSLTTNVPKDHNIFCYVVSGSLKINNEEVEALQLVELNNDDEEISIEAKEESILLFGHAKPFEEPVVAMGPFVMNSEQEIQEAYEDFNSGKMGVWKA